MIKRIPTGFTSLDRLIRGFTPGQLIVIGGRPSLGKTAFALGLAKNITQDPSYKCMYFSLESTILDIEIRWEKMFGPLKRPSNIIVIDTIKLTVEKIRAYSEEHIKGDTRAVLIIDYLQLMNIVNPGEKRREEQMNEIMRELKDLSKEFHCSVIILSQVNRSLESRPDKRPICSDLRESGCLEQDADLIAMIYRDKFYDQNSEFENSSEILVRKNRSGSIGLALLTWDETRFAFVN